MTVQYSKSLCSMLLCASMVVNSTVMAQWGNNAPPCSNGQCAPTTVWGYHATCWRRWPNAVYPDMVAPTQPTNRGTTGIQPDNIELPPSTGEADVRPPSPTRQPQYSPTPRPGLDEGFREPAPLDQPFQSPEPGVRDAIPSPHSSVPPKQSYPVSTPAESAPPATTQPSEDTTTMQQPTVNQPRGFAPQLGAAQVDTPAQAQGEMRIDLGAPSVASKPEVIFPEATSQTAPISSSPETAKPEVPLQLASANAEMDDPKEDSANPYPANSLQRRLRANSIRAKAKVRSTTSSKPVEAAAKPEAIPPVVLEQSETSITPTLVIPQPTTPDAETTKPAEALNQTLESSRRSATRPSEVVPATHFEPTKSAAPEAMMPISSPAPAYRTAPNSVPGSGKSSLPESNPLRSGTVKPASFQLPEQPAWRPASSPAQTPASASSTFQSNPLR